MSATILNHPTRRAELIRRLVIAQRHEPHVDILTITGFMTDEQVEAHLKRYERPEAE